MTEPARWKRINPSIHNGECGPYRLNTIKVGKPLGFSWSVAHSNWPTYAMDFAKTERSARAKAVKLARLLIKQGSPTMTPEQQKRFDEFEAKERKRRGSK